MNSANWFCSPKFVLFLSSWKIWRVLTIIFIAIRNIIWSCQSIRRRLKLNFSFDFQPKPSRSHNKQPTFCVLSHFYFRFYFYHWTLLLFFIIVSASIHLHIKLRRPLDFKKVSKLLIVLCLRKSKSVFDAHYEKCGDFSFLLHFVVRKCDCIVRSFLFILKINIFSYFIFVPWKTTAVRITSVQNAINSLEINVIKEKMNTFYLFMKKVVFGAELYFGLQLLRWNCLKCPIENFEEEIFVIDWEKEFFSFEIIPFLIRG